MTVSTQGMQLNVGSRVISALVELLSSMRYGLVEIKVRYYFKYKIQWAIKFRKEILNKGLKLWLKGLFGQK